MSINWRRYASIQGLYNRILQKEILSTATNYRVSTSTLGTTYCHIRRNVYDSNLTNARDELREIRPHYSTSDHTSRQVQKKFMLYSTHLDPCLKLQRIWKRKEETIMQIREKITAAHK